MVAIVGPSGGGKTTLCHLIPRFYEISSGSISVDGHDIRTVTRSSLRQKIGIVQQDVFLFTGTIFDNIAYGKLGASREEVVEAAKKANIHDYIMSLPEGYETFVVPDDVGGRFSVLTAVGLLPIAVTGIDIKALMDGAAAAREAFTQPDLSQNECYKYAVLRNILYRKGKSVEMFIT